MPTLKARYTRKLIVFLKPEDYDNVIALAQAREVTLSNILRDALSAYLAQHKPSSVR